MLNRCLKLIPWMITAVLISGVIYFGWDLTLPFAALIFILVILNP